MLEVISITEEDTDPIGAEQLMEIDIYSNDFGVDGQVRAREVLLMYLWN